MVLDAGVVDQHVDPPETFDRGGDDRAAVFDPGELIALMESERVTNMCMVPAMLQVLTAMPDIEKRDFGALEVIVYGASPITPALLRRSMDVFGCEFVQFYGMTETARGTTYLKAEDHDPDGPRAHLLRSAGKPFGEVEVRITDVDSGVQLAAGQVGEIQTRSPHNTRGYWDRPADNVALLAEDAWLRTGDTGYLDQDGYLFAEVAVIGTPHVKWGEAVTAVVVVKPGVDTPSEQEIIDFTTGRLASYKKPGSSYSARCCRATPAARSSNASCATRSDRRLDPHPDWPRTNCPPAEPP